MNLIYILKYFNFNIQLNSIYILFGYTDQFLSYSFLSFSVMNTFFNTDVSSSMLLINFGTLSKHFNTSLKFDY